MSMIDTELSAPDIMGREAGLQAAVKNGNYPCLILNADYQPLSYFPLSLWSWQDAVKAVFLDRVSVVNEYEQIVRAASFEMPIPSVVALKDYVPQNRSPAFTRFNLFLRDGFECVYCGSGNELTFDHLIPRAVILRREAALLKMLACVCGSRLFARLCTSYRRRDESFRLTIYMRAGLTIYIGI